MPLIRTRVRLFAQSRSENSMSLKDLLVQDKPRDTSGALSSDRFAYQHNWALCRLLFMHQDKNDYVMTFDHHEDVTVLDSEDSPKSNPGVSNQDEDDRKLDPNGTAKEAQGAGRRTPLHLRKALLPTETVPRTR